jgi:hypothetical protein
MNDDESTVVATGNLLKLAIWVIDLGLGICCGWMNIKKVMIIQSNSFRFSTFQLNN